MVEVHLLNRLRALAEHRRWLLGVAPSARYGRLTAALVAVQGTGLEARGEVILHRRVEVPRDVVRGYRRLCGISARPPNAPLLAARLAEYQAALLDELAADIAPVWQNVSAVAVHGPGVASECHGLRGYAGLCDAARLADLTGLNVIDGFAQRDVALDGRGSPLLALPYWLLLHDLRKVRALVQVGGRVRATVLFPSRESAAPLRTSRAAHKLPAAAVPSDMATAAVAAIRDAAGPSVRVEEAIVCGRAHEPAVRAALGSQVPDVRLMTLADLGVPRGSLAAAAAAMLGLLYLDHVPANLPTLTGARTARVLGRLTPGSVVHWHRLVRELAARRPSTVTLRSAI